MSWAPNGKESFHAFPEPVFRWRSRVPSRGGEDLRLRGGSPSYLEAWTPSILRSRRFGN